MSDARAKAAGLGCWREVVTPRPLEGGISNENFVVHHAGEKFFVRIGDDIPAHGVMRWHELAASRAAHAAGISPELTYHEPGALVFRFVEGTTLTEDSAREHRSLERIVPLLRRAHREIPRYFRGPVLAFWVFQVLRDYAATITHGDSRHVGHLPRLMSIADRLEHAVGEVELRFGHNDLLAANFIDDGERLWLFDWEYSGFNSPLFDLGGFASNNLLTPPQEDWLLEAYYERPVGDELRHRYTAMKCASLLRETMWSMVSEIHLNLDIDYVAYTAKNLERFDAAWRAFQLE